MTRRDWTRWLLAACTALLLAACGGGDSDDAASGPAKTTLMVYLVASDMTDETARILSEMEEARASKDVNVLVQVGGGDSPGELPDIDMQETRRYRLVPDPEDKGASWALEALPQNQQPATSCSGARASTRPTGTRWSCPTTAAAPWAALAPTRRWATAKRCRWRACAARSSNRA